MLTTAEAAKLAQMPRVTIQKAVKRGALAAKRGRVNGRHVYLIDEDDLLDFKNTSYCPDKGDRWSEADEAALIELADTCTARQIAEYLGRSEVAVTLKTTKFRRQGLMERTPGLIGRGKLPFCLPVGAILVARSCLRCGKLRDASQFRSQSDNRYRLKGLRYDHECRWCLNNRRREDGPQRRAKTKRLQDITLENATKRGQPYSDDEVRQILDPERSEFELALTLGRTYYAILGRRSDHGFNPRPVKPSVVKSHWLIHFPNAAKALQEHFIRLGVPDDQWDDVA